MLASFVASFLALLSFGRAFLVSPSCHGAGELVADAVASGDLGRARRAALEQLRSDAGCERALRDAYAAAADAALARDEASFIAAVAAAAAREGDAAGDAACSDERATAAAAAAIPLADAASWWDACCGELASAAERARCDGGARGEDDGACAFAADAPSHLRLPALRETRVRVRVATGAGRACTLALEQDGWLRPFDPPTVLWPAGLLLALCVAEPAGRCGLGRAELGAKTLELGAGVAAPSVALLAGAAARGNGGGSGRSAPPPRVVAADVAPRALALAAANGARHGVALDVAAVDWHALAAGEPAALAALGGAPFDAVIGASLQELFDGGATLGRLLGRVLRPGGLVVLAHPLGALDGGIGGGAFALRRRVAGDEFGLASRDGGASEFEVTAWEHLGGEGGS